MYLLLWSDIKGGYIIDMDGYGQVGFPVDQVRMDLIEICVYLQI